MLGTHILLQGLQFFSQFCEIPRLEYFKTLFNSKTLSYWNMEMYIKILCILIYFFTYPEMLKVTNLCFLSQDVPQGPSLPSNLLACLKIRTVK